MSAETEEFGRLGEEISELLVKEAITPEELDARQIKVFYLLVGYLANPDSFPSQPINSLIRDLRDYLGEASVRLGTGLYSRLEKPAYLIRPMEAAVHLPENYDELVLTALREGRLSEEIARFVGFASKVRDHLDARFFADFSDLHESSLEALINQRAMIFVGESLRTYSRVEPRFIPNSNERWLIEEFGRKINTVDTFIPTGNFLDPTTRIY